MPRGYLYEERTPRAFISAATREHTDYNHMLANRTFRQLSFERNRETAQNENRTRGLPISANTKSTGNCKTNFQVIGCLALLTATGTLGQ